MEEIKIALDSFITNKEKNVFALKGDWGVGKTFFLKNYIESSELLNEKVISYTSLFGINDIDDLRSQIFYSSFKKGVGAQNKMRNLWVKVLNLAKDIEVVKNHAASLIEAHQDVTANNSIIVIDDIERRGPTLGLGQVLGLVSYLKEQFNCKIIIVLNEDQLDEESSKELSKYREKVLDVEVKYNPPISFNAKIFFKDDAYFHFAYEIYQSLKCNNLRVIQKSYNSFSDFKSLLDGSETEVQLHVLKQVVLLSSLFNLYGNKINFSGLKAYFTRRVLAKNADKETEGDRLLGSVNYYPSDIDPIIIDYLQSGMLDKGSLNQVLEKMNEMEIKGRVIERFRSIFHIYNSNFRSSFKEFHRELSSFLNENINKIDWSNLVLAHSFLEENGKKAESKKWVDKWITNALPSINDVKLLKQFHDVTDSKKIKFEITKKFKAKISKKNPGEIILNASSKEVDALDFEILLAHSESHYYKWLKTETNEDLLSSLSQFLSLYGSRDAESNEKKFCDRLIKVLGKIAKENKFNERRITKFMKVNV